MRLPPLPPLPPLLAALVTVSCSSHADSIATTGQFRVEAWSDNWFAMYDGDTLLQEDSVSIETERSFNKEVFGFDGAYPLNLNVILKDYKANDTGLEYIGTAQQQMGDGGFIMQIKDTLTGDYVAVSNQGWQCLVIHRAPTDVSCEDSATPEVDCASAITAEPSGWMDAGYDTSAWPAAVEYSTDDVKPKEGYDEVSWDASAKLIWSSSLKQDNTLLCKVSVAAP
jgi:hypothetical protein